MVAKLLVVLGGLCALALVLFLCNIADDASTLTFENELSETVDIHGEGTVIVDNLEPGESYEHMVLPYDSIETYEARNKSGDVLASVTLSWNELRELDFRVVFD